MRASHSRGTRNTRQARYRRDHVAFGSRHLAGMRTVLSDALSRSGGLAGEVGRADEALAEVDLERLGRARVDGVGDEERVDRLVRELAQVEDVEDRSERHEDRTIGDMQARAHAPTEAVADVFNLVVELPRAVGTLAEEASRVEAVRIGPDGGIAADRPCIVSA